jgi:hypothetical protein
MIRQVNLRSKTPVLAIGNHPCTISGCSCTDFVMSALNSIVCATCGHSDQDHNLP